MLFFEKVFDNFFDKSTMSKLNFLEFVKDHLQRLISSNVNHVHDAVIASLTLLIAQLQAEVNTENYSINLRGSKTLTVEQLIDNFSHQMSSLEGVISHAIGGKDTPAYLEFFPNGLKEYNKPSMKIMPILSDRITRLATKYATILGVNTTAELITLGGEFVTSRVDQVAAKSDVITNKLTLSSNRTILELAVTDSVHDIAKLYKGNKAAAGSLFNFNLLYSVAHHPHTEYIGDILPVAEATVLNQSLGETMQIVVDNTGNNADFWIWIGHIPNDPLQGKVAQVKAGKSANFKPSDLGALSDTYLTIKNASSTNTASYKVTIIG